VGSNTSEYLNEDRSNIYAIDRNSLTVVGYDYAIAGSASSNVLEINVKDWRDELIQKVGDSKKTVLIYGFVAYFHVFSKTDRQECWFRYLYRPSAQGLERISPKEKEYEDRDSESQKQFLGRT
jgi:hypothetical protein